jgi:predicted ATP-dependent serine protease
MAGADGGVCGAEYEGFMCRECIDGYAKVAGFCVECDSFNFLMFAQSVLYNFVVAFALLHVSTIAVVSSSEFKQIWYKVSQASQTPTVPAPAS